MSSPTGTECRVTVFGGLTLWRGGGDVDLGPARQRALLAMLVVSSGAVVGVSDLVEALWGWGDPPASAVNQLHRMVGQLRRLFEPNLSTREAGRLLQGSGTGYRLMLDADQCDLLAFRSALGACRADAAAGRWGAAALGFGNALDMAAGEPFAGLDEEVLARPEFVQLRRERLGAASQALDAGLACSQLGSVMGPCERIAASAPLDEALQARLVRALAAGGRRAEALELAHRTRRSLADELGIDPGPELAAAMQEVLHADALPSAPTATSPTVPRQLPPEVQGFVERSGAAFISKDQVAAVADAGTVAITAVGGMGGVGKTALAVHWAHQLAPLFPDGQLYVNLRGFDPGGRVLSPSDALGLLLESMGVVLASLGDEQLEARSARFRTLLAGRRMLLLLDNARDSAQVRPLLPSTPGCLVLVTSRNQLGGLVAHEGARAVSLDRLEPDDARRMLSMRVGVARIAFEPEAVEDLIAACAGLPLALSMVAAKATLNPRRPLADLAAEVAHNRLDALTTGEADDGVRATFAASYTTLSVDAARLFRLLAVHPGPEISFASAVSLTGSLATRVRAGFNELATAAMVVEPVSGRFVLHDLLRAYAGEQVDDDERTVAETRLVEHYVRSTRNAYLTAGRPPLMPLTDPLPGVDAETFADFDDATAWYARDRAVLYAIVQMAIAGGELREAALLVLDWRPMNQTVDAPADALPMSLAALTAAITLGDPLLQAELHRDVAGKYGRTHRHAEAAPHYEESLAGFRVLGDLVGQANTLRNLATGAAFARDFETASRFAAQSIEVARSSGRTDIVAVCLASSASTLTSLGEYEPALAAIDESIALATAASLSYLDSYITFTRTECLYRLGRFTDTVHAASSGLTSLSDRDKPIIFALLALLAAAALEEGDLAVARDAARRAEPMLAESAAWSGNYGPEIWTTHVPEFREVAARLEKLDSSQT
jgi:DNA-binding SARP family transcriptional activator/tetratricopeptide (TPR) repeat protein